MTVSQTLIFSGTGDIQLEARDGAYQEYLAAAGGYGAAITYWIRAGNGGQLIDTNGGQWETGTANLISGDILKKLSVDDGSLGSGVYVPFNLDRNIVTLIGP